MLTDPQEIRIISAARSKTVRDPKRSREHFERIFADFLPDVRFEGARLLDIGPGQYDFGEMARARGAEVFNIDKDPAVVELGRYKGFPVIEAGIKKISRDQFPCLLDGVFCKFSINAFWLPGDAQLAHIDEICSMLQPEGWGWIAPWNGVPKNQQLDRGRVQEILARQADGFRRHGFEGLELTPEQSLYYGVHGHTANCALFIRNIPLPGRLHGNRRL